MTRLVTLAAVLTCAVAATSCARTTEAPSPAPAPAVAPSTVAPYSAPTSAVAPPPGPASSPVDVEGAQPAAAADPTGLATIRLTSQGWGANRLGNLVQPPDGAIYNDDCPGWTFGNPGDPQMVWIAARKKGPVALIQVAWPPTRTDDDIAVEDPVAAVEAVPGILHESFPAQDVYYKDVGPHRLQYDVVDGKVAVITVYTPHDPTTVVTFWGQELRCAP